MFMSTRFLLLCLTSLLFWHSTDALVSSPVSKLLIEHQSLIEDLNKAVPDHQESDISLLRHALSEDPTAQLQATVDWQTSERGSRICAAARTAVQQATASSTSWNNQGVQQAAPHIDLIGQYLTPTSCVTTTSSTGDLVYCIRAGSIKDKELMKIVTVDQLVDFFLYAKEVNGLVANERSLVQDRFVSIVTCNDLSGVKLVGGSADFRAALSASSKLANQVYPKSLSGPTLLLNLPKLLSALVKLFTPLFPEPVKKRLKFKQGLLKDVVDLREIASSSKSAQRTEFLQELDKILDE